MITIIRTKKLDKLLTLKASNKRAEIIDYLMNNYDNFSYGIYKNGFGGSSSIVISVGANSLQFNKVKSVNHLKKLIAAITNPNK